MPYREGKQWRAHIMVNGVRVTGMFATKGQAKRFEEQERKRLRNAEKVSPDTDLQTLSYKYLDYIHPRMSQKTYNEKQSLCVRLGKTWGNQPLLSITPEMVSDFLLAQAKTRSPNASNKDRKNLLAMWNWGRKFLAVNHNPLAAIDQLPHARTVQYTPPEEDIAKLIMAADRTEKVFLDCYLQTGARRSEIFRLTWNDINFEAQTITLWSRKNRRGEWEAQTIDMNDELSSGLQWWRKAPENNYKDESFVWIDHHPGPNQGKPFKVRRKFMRDLCERADIKPFGFHALRRFVASYLADSGKVSIKRIQELLRHKNLATTERYIKRIGTGNRETVGILEGIGQEKIHV